MPSTRGLVALVAIATLGACQEGGSSRGSAAAAATAPIASPTTTATNVVAQGTLKALSYNVAGLPQGLSQSNPATFIPMISPLLNGYDLVLCQEDFWYHSQLERDAQHTFRSTPLTGYTSLVNDGLNRFSNAWFYDFTRVRWAVCYGVWSAGADCLASKGFSAARHELAPGYTIDVYNLHADAGGSGDDESARATQFQQLANFIAVYSAGQAVVVAGDTNLKRARPNDAQTLNTFMAAAGLLEVGQVMGTPDHIDRFLWRDSANITLVPARWREADEFVDASGNDLSDHPAIHVDFDYTITK